MKAKISIGIHPRAILFALMIFMLPLSFFLETHTELPLISYTDELLSIICIAYLLILPFKIGLKRADFGLLILMLLIMALAFAGNIKYKITTNWFIIIVDAVCLAKVILPFIVFKFVGETDKNMLIAKYLIPISKIMILAASIMAIPAQIMDIGMSGEKRYGMHSYYFVFLNESRFGLIIACCFLILLVTNTLSPKKRTFYEALTIFNLILTTKGVVYIIIVVYVVLKFMWRRRVNYTLSPLTIAALAGTGIVVSSFQIRTYLMDDTSPRTLFVKYGFRTAKSCFPFGSGFATYGSDMAAKNYSNLYLVYGFNKIYGMTPKNGMFLNDCYMGMVAGQFGYIGLALFLVVIAIIFTVLYKVDRFGRSVKALTMAIFASLVLSAIGTAIIKSSIGVMVLCVLGLVCGYANTNTIKRPINVKIKF